MFERRLVDELEWLLVVVEAHQEQVNQDEVRQTVQIDRGVQDADYRVQNEYLDEILVLHGEHIQPIRSSEVGEQVEAEHEDGERGARVVNVSAQAAEAVDSNEVDPDDQRRNVDAEHDDVEDEARDVVRVVDKLVND